MAPPRRRLAHSAMKIFAQFLIVACVGLLSWWQTELHAGTPLVSLAWAAAGVVTAWLTWRSSRTGYSLAVVLGLAYLTELILRLDRTSLTMVQPLLMWASALIVCGVLLLWASRERKRARPLYERFPEY